jgi:hypothetical protein
VWADTVHSDWDKFARAEYDRLSSEDDQVRLGVPRGAGNEADDGPVQGVGGDPVIDEDDSSAWAGAAYSQTGPREAPF